MTATTFLPSVISLVAVLAVARQSKRLQPRTATTLLAAGCVVAVATSAVAVASVVLDQSTVPHAVAVPGHPGQVVVTTGLLAVPDPFERRAVLAHEFATSAPQARRTMTNLYTM